MLSLVLAILASQVANPTTVNDAELGPADQFRTAGPASVCMRKMRITADAGQSVYLSYLGIHQGGLRLVIGDRDVVFLLGEIWAEPKRSRTLVSRQGEMAIYRFGRGHRAFYGAYAPDEYSHGKPKLLVRINGSALMWDKRDEILLRHVSLDPPGAGKCQRSYSFGWDEILGDEPANGTAKQ